MENPRGDIERLEQGIEINAPIEAVFDFHVDTNNLLKITPSHISVSFTTDGEPGVGQTIDLTVKHLGIIPTKWVVQFTDYQRPNLLVDEQIKGPFAFWKQTRHFERSGNGTKLTDIIEYQAPLGRIGKLGSRLFINRQIMNMFTFRQKKTKELIESASSA